MTIIGALKSQDHNLCINNKDKRLIWADWTNPPQWRVIRMTSHDISRVIITTENEHEAVAVLLADDAPVAVEPLTPVDQFAWSSHVEIVAVFRR